MRIAIATLGCKINQYDSAVIQTRAERAHTFVSFEEPADCYIINSCTVTDRADWEARQLVRRAKRRNPRARVIVTGCYAQVSPGELAAIPEVDHVIGLNRLDDLLRALDLPRPAAGPSLSVGDVRTERRVPVLGTRALPGHTRAFLKVQEGCNYSCTYCIIPIARGLSRSVPPRVVLEQIRKLADSGCREVVLTGIHLGSYGQDLKPRLDLTGLVAMIVERELVPRLRLSSLDPREVPDRLLELMRSAATLCPHLHICAQAGTDALLRAMRRNYDTAYYRELVQKVRERLPEASIGSDIIVGFPGETDHDFEHSLAFFRSLPLTYFHVFPYSGRRGTPAAGMPGQVSSAEKKARSRRMRELGNEKKRAFSASFRGRTLPVLIEDKVDPGSGRRKGFTRNYLSVAVAGGTDGLVNREIAVRIERLEQGVLVGHPVTVPAP